MRLGGRAIWRQVVVLAASLAVMAGSVLAAPRYDPEQHVQPAELLLAHRHHRHAQHSRNPKKRESVISIWHRGVICILRLQANRRITAIM